MTAAAPAGGVTTIIDMPLISIPPTCDVPALEVKGRRQRAAATSTSGSGWRDPRERRGAPAAARGGRVRLKSFLLPSGVDEFPRLDQAGLEAAMREIASFGGLLIVHAEDSLTSPMPRMAGVTRRACGPGHPRPSSGRSGTLLTLAAGTGAGQGRLSAVTTLCSLLGDAKFLQYLTDKRTQALLGLASDDRKAVDESSLRWIQTLAVLVLRSSHLFG